MVPAVKRGLRSSRLRRVRKSPIVSWLTSPVRLKFDHVEHEHWARPHWLALDASIGGISVHRVNNYATDIAKAKRQLVRWMLRQWPKMIRGFEREVHAVVMVLLHEKYKGTSRYRPPGTWTRGLMRQHLVKDLKNGLTYSECNRAVSWMQHLAREGLLTSHHVRSPHRGECEPYYTVNLSYPGVTKGEVAIGVHEAAASAAAAAKAAIQRSPKPRSKPKMMACVACGGSGDNSDYHRQDDSSRRGPDDDCCLCKGTGKISETMSTRTMARRAVDAGKSINVKLVPRGARGRASDEIPHSSPS